VSTEPRIKSPRSVFRLMFSSSPVFFFYLVKDKRIA